ncbi:MAG TPA: transcriptional regulator [Nitriliruptorales bacterium]
MTEGEYQRQLGERLRAIRAQQDLTLQEVEERSAGRWKAVVVGSYERGDRAISITKLAELGRFYGVPLADLLPQAPPDVPDEAADPEPTLVIDLTKLDDEVAHDPRFTSVRRYAQRIQVRRGDYNGRVLTLRAGDLAALAAVFDTDTDDLVVALQNREVVRQTR